MRLALLIAAALLWAGAASAQSKGGGYEIDPEPKRPDLEPRSHFQGVYAGGTLGVGRSSPNAAPFDGSGVNANPHFGVQTNPRGSAPGDN
jgi:hypothetical protein